MAPRRRALRDYGDARPLMALARAALREAAEARARAREGLENHLRLDAACQILSALDPPEPADDLESA